MQPLFADAIDFPLVFMYGMAVLVPLILFQVIVEGLILRYVWRLPFPETARFAFRANCWSLIAGIPTKILNAVIYGMLLPRDIPAFFARYPLAVAVGTLLYFIVTVLVEFLCAVRWRRRSEAPIAQRSLWNGILLANLATYTVLAPLYYYATRPIHDVREFAHDARWSRHPDTEVVFTDSENEHLKMTRLGGTADTTIVPAPVRDYLISSNGGICLFRTKGGGLVLFQRSSGRSNLIWQTSERFSMNQVAFSPLGERVAFATEKDRQIEVVDVRTGRRTRKEHPAGSRDCHIAWSPEEPRFYVSDGRTNRLVAHITSEFSLTLETFKETNDPPLLLCYGRVGPGRWFSGSDWGQSYHMDKCADLRAWAERGLGSSLRIYRDNDADKPQFTMAVNPGLLHLASIGFGDVAFLEGCKECIFEAGEHVYLVDFERKNLGTVVRGQRFILFTSHYQKHLVLAE